MKGEVDILGNFPIDTSLKKKAHSAMDKGLSLVMSTITNAQKLVASRSTCSHTVEGSPSTAMSAISSVE